MVRTAHRGAALGITVLVGVVGSACSSDGSEGSSPPSTTAAATPDWAGLRNPVYAPEHMVKDVAVVAEEGRWHLYGSERWESPEDEDRHAVASSDLADWTPLPGTSGDQFDSPDITRQPDGTWLMTHQRRFGAPELAVDRIVVRTARSPEGPWSEPQEILTEQFPGQRLIDGAVAPTPDGLYLIAKRGDRDVVPQVAEVFRSPSGAVEGPWEHLGAADVGWTENFQFLSIDGVWHLLLTAIPVHTPTLYALRGDPGDPSAWLHWRQVGELDVPAETWNSSPDPADVDPGFTFERANSAYLVDHRPVDGFFYLFYAGSTELTSHEGRGLAQVGVARSTDLERWVVPG